MPVNCTCEYLCISTSAPQSRPFSNSLGWPAEHLTCPTQRGGVSGLTQNNSRERQPGGRQLARSLYIALRKPSGNAIRSTPIRCGHRSRVPWDSEWVTFSWSHWSGHNEQSVTIAHLEELAGTILRQDLHPKTQPLKRFNSLLFISVHDNRLGSGPDLRDAGVSSRRRGAEGGGF